MLTILAARYARALADVVREPASLEKSAGELEALARLLGESKPLRDFLLNPSFPLSRKTTVLETLARRSGASVPTQRLLQLLLRKGRLNLLGEISREFRRMEEEKLDRVAVEVTTAMPLDAAQRKRMTASLQRFTGKTVRLEARVDPGILGGARARIGSVVYDGSVAGRMQRLKRRLIGER
jgi:F-type H+-transporting ATPase subunit delta